MRRLGFGDISKITATDFGYIADCDKPKNRIEKKLIIDGKISII